MYFTSLFANSEDPGQGLQYDLGPSLLASVLKWDVRLISVIESVSFQSPITDIIRKPVFGVSYQVCHKLSCTTTEDG